MSSGSASALTNNRIGGIWRAEPLLSECHDLFKMRHIEIDGDLDHFRQIGAAGLVCAQDSKVACA